MDHAFRDRSTTPHWRAHRARGPKKGSLNEILRRTRKRLGWKKKRYVAWTGWLNYDPRLVAGIRSRQYRTSPGAPHTPCCARGLQSPWPLGAHIASPPLPFAWRTVRCVKGGVQGACFRAGQVVTHPNRARRTCSSCRSRPSQNEKTPDQWPGPQEVGARITSTVGPTPNPRGASD